MTDDLYTSLAWLPAPPRDFAARVKNIDAMPAPGAPCRALAGHALDDNQLGRLGRVIIRAQQQGRDLSPLQPFRLGILGNGTLDLFVPLLVASAARYGFALDCIVAPYGQIAQQAFTPDSVINSSKPDAVLLAVDHRGLPLRFVAGDESAERAAVESALAYLTDIRQAIRRQSGAIALVQTIPPPPEVLFGSFDRVVPGTKRRVIEAINRGIAESVSGTEDLLLDIATLAETIGLGLWHSPALWNMAKLGCDNRCMPIYGEHVARLLAALRGRSRKCLVLDLDNTVWGGVIGDDGLEGIKLAQGDATGEAHLAVQEMALTLRQRGIVLAVSSKNDEAVARAPFQKHPEMRLKEDHFAVFQANWQDKATNIKAIAEELCLGLDAMVLIDDNPVERDLVRQMLPQVAVPELPEDPALFARTLAAAGYFESVAFSAEDRERAEMYQSNARRVALQNQAGDLDSYLASLEMEIVFGPFDRTGRARISQLINKSNQFNLTTRRYSEADVATAETDREVFTLQVRLIDRLGDNGMICAIICRTEADENDSGRTWRIDTWLMSCRVLGRKVEQMVLREILMRAREEAVDTLVGVYRPSEKNAMVRDHYARLGFSKLSEEADGTTIWALACSTEIEAAPMAVRHFGRELAEV
ncbi:MAG TPA: HAD-IIIC family phosphatase [Stellaceae bacterium]|jgi:FkbH-like protein